MASRDTSAAAESLHSVILQDALRKVFGHSRLRTGQAEVIERVMAGLPTLAIMPTGAGKSLCYQLPAVVLPGRTVVVSPLIALMKDQCDKLRRRGIEAVQVHSALTSAELAQAEQSIDDGSARFVLTTPERLADPVFVQRLSARPVSLVAVDEAHCISQWGHDFRPAFLEISLALQALGRPPVLALTATAGDDVAADIMKHLRIPRSGLIDTGAYRSNLQFAVELMADEKGRLDRVAGIVNQTPGAGIVYAATVKAALQAFDALKERQESVALYHGKLGARERSDAQEAFMTGAVRIMVATNAFGMGIDKPDIRFVLHCQMPSSVHAYYQEAGRAGRDGEIAQCVLLFLAKDRSVQQFFLAGRYPQLEDLDAIYRQLLATPENSQGWKAASLLEALARPRSRMQSGIALLRTHKVLKVDRQGTITLRPRATKQENIDFEKMLQAYKERRSQDRETLERMLGYAQSGQCRWQLLLSELDATASLKRCGTCDNCRRIDAHEAAMPQSIVLCGRTEAPSPRIGAGVGFAANDAVKVGRFGAGTVTAADTSAITVAFPDGSQRSFHPDFVTHSLAAKNPVRTPKSTSAPNAVPG